MKKKDAFEMNKPDQTPYLRALNERLQLDQRAVIPLPEHEKALMLAVLESIGK